MEKSYYKEIINLSDSSDSEHSSVKLGFLREPELDSGSNLTDLMDEFQSVLNPSSPKEVKSEPGPVKEPVHVKKRSGAQKRKRARQRVKGERLSGDPGPSLCDLPKPGSSKDPDGAGIPQVLGPGPSRDSEPETPSPEARKKVKTDVQSPGPSFAAISAGCKVAVVPVDYPNSYILPEQVSEFGDKLLAVVDSLKADIENGPGFWGFSFQTGGLLLTCADQKTRDWLHGIIGNIQLGGLRLKLERPETLVKTIRVGGHFPGSPPPKPMQLVHRLVVQNPRVRELIRHWVPVGCKSYSEGGFFAAFKIPETHIRDLGNLNFLVHYSIVAVKLNILDNTRKRKGSALGAQTGTSEKRHQSKIKKGPPEPKKGTSSSLAVDKNVGAPMSGPALSIPCTNPPLSVSAKEHAKQEELKGRGNRAGRPGAADGEDASSSGGAATGEPGNEPPT